MFRIPDEKKIRVIIDTDAACEADDPFAIVHALMSPKLIVRGICAEHFVLDGSVEKSMQEIETILQAMCLETPAFMGQKGPLDGCSEISPAVKFIIEEALREDEKPLYMLCQGAITNLAMAFRKCPEIRNRMTVIWIGSHGAGEREAAFREFNAGNVLLRQLLTLDGVIFTLYIVAACIRASSGIQLLPLQKIIDEVLSLMKTSHGVSSGKTAAGRWSAGFTPSDTQFQFVVSFRFCSTSVPFVQMTGWSNEPDGIELEDVLSTAEPLNAAILTSVWSQCPKRHPRCGS